MYYTHIEVIQYFQMGNTTMHNYTAATFNQHRYGDELTASADHRCSIARSSAVIDPAELSNLMRSDKLAAAERLAALDAQKLIVQAAACTTWFNELFGFDAGEGLQSEQLIERFQTMVAVYRASRVEE